MDRNLRIWIDLSEEGKEVVSQLKKKYIVKHKLTASPKPVVDYMGCMIVGLGNIRRHFNLK